MRPVDSRSTAHRRSTAGRKPEDDRTSLSAFTPDTVSASTEAGDHDEFDERGCCSRAARSAQNGCYQFLAATLWDSIMSGFRPGRVRAMELLNVQASDRVLLIGEGSGLDFDCLPEGLDRSHVYALDYSTEMVKQAKRKARLLGIPEANIVVGDAQHLPYTTERFTKIYFPLSLGSIPNPRLALQEAERVLASNGRIVVFEKMVDEDATISMGRSYLNFFTRYIFADINRRLTQMMGTDSAFKVVGYESLSGRLEGCLASTIAPSYRLATLTRITDFPDEPAVRATLS